MSWRKRLTVLSQEGFAKSAALSLYLYPKSAIKAATTFAKKMQ